ncbi:hypothetical protein SD77_4437 [Bacillus badius]|uniref:Uncharacterized protein n=1 Tax=Bacillus badius TaxID=1455 RepID=A0ABR5AVJ4_BACBA|nr:hypothetical protein SD78_0742 [Bacillus badius]KIL78757.1 hypothetical protein SD77_4437 [Bacillus badius]
MIEEIADAGAAYFGCDESQEIIYSGRSIFLSNDLKTI